MRQLTVCAACDKQHVDEKNKHDNLSNWLYDIQSVPSSECQINLVVN